MTLQQLRQEFERLAHANSLKECDELLSIYSNFLLTAIIEGRQKVATVAEGEAKLMLQMMLTKTLHLKEIIKGVNFSSKRAINLNNIIDPTIVAVLIRNTYETVATFNLIYRTNKKGDERIIVYNLWTLAGLNYRQRFRSMISTEDSRIKWQSEQGKIDTFTTEIQNTRLFKRISQNDKAKILQQIAAKKYLISFEDDQVKFLTWQMLSSTMGCNNDYFISIYTYFSLYAHPSNVAVFQFADMFDKESKEYLSMTLFNMEYFFMLLSIFIADYITLFPSALVTFNKLELIDQILIDTYNTFARDMTYTINGCQEKLNG